jgi:hypothetical protein
VYIYVLVGAACAASGASMALQRAGASPLVAVTCRWWSRSHSALSTLSLLQASGRFDLKEPYYRLTQWAQVQAPQQQQQVIQQQPALLPSLVAVQDPAVAGLGAAAGVAVAGAAAGGAQGYWAHAAQEQTHGMHAV